MLILLHSTTFSSVVVCVRNHHIDVRIHRMVDLSTHFGNRLFHINIHPHLLDLLLSMIRGNHLVLVGLILNIFDLLKLVSQLNLVLLDLVFHVQNVLVIIGLGDLILARISIEAGLHIINLREAHLVVLILANILIFKSRGLNTLLVSLPLP